MASPQAPPGRDSLLLVLDGVYTAAIPWARPVFHPAPDLEDEDVADAVHAMRVRIVRLLRRRGLWPEPGEQDTSASRDPDSQLPFLTAASIQGRVALGPDAGRPVERLRQPPTDAPRFEPGSLCAALDGFSLRRQRSNLGQPEDLSSGRRPSQPHRPRRFTTPTAPLPRSPNPSRQPGYHGDAA